MSMRAASSIAGANAEQVLFVIRNADLTLATDQVFSKLFGGTNYIVTNIFAVRKSGAFGVACLGGIYTGAGKTGDAIMAAAQSWATLTGANTSVVAGLGNLLQTKVSIATPILSLTTANTGALSADVFILGIAVD